MIWSDASLQCWGVMCNGTRTRGAWFQEEQRKHINCLELLAATLALQFFWKDKQVQLQLNNQTLTQIETSQSFFIQ